MKVIAVMTMAFLPATFIAALFAVPSLKWDASPVMQDNFWIYWVFAIPLTAMVFVCWFLASRNTSQFPTITDRAQRVGEFKEAFEVRKRDATGWVNRLRYRSSHIRESGIYE